MSQSGNPAGIGSAIFPHLAEVAQGFRRTLPASITLYATGTAILVTAWIFSTIHDQSLPFHMLKFFAKNLFQFGSVILLAAAGYKVFTLFRAGSKESPTRALLSWAGRGLVRDDALARFAHTLAATTLMFVGFTFLKESIPQINPFSWDRYFHELDVFLHFGRTPWEWLQPYLGHPLITAALNIVYNLWFVLMFGSLVAMCCYMQDLKLRNQYLLAFMATWFLGGNLLAILFSSAGPAFYADLGLGDAAYGGLMAYLAAADQQYPIWALPIQKELWDSYTGVAEGVSGISAMPSMHVGTSVLMTFLAFRFGRLWGYAMIGFSLLIMIGSVHLAWHYAVDGYLGAALAATVWYICGRVVEKEAIFLEKFAAPAKV